MKGHLQGAPRSVKQTCLQEHCEKDFHTTFVLVLLWFTRHNSSTYRSSVLLLCWTTHLKAFCLIWVDSWAQVICVMKNHKLGLLHAMLTVHHYILCHKDNRGWQSRAAEVLNTKIRMNLMGADMLGPRTAPSYKTNVSHLGSLTHSACVLMMTASLGGTLFCSTVSLTVSQFYTYPFISTT